MLCTRRTGFCMYVLLNWMIKGIIPVSFGRFARDALALFYCYKNIKTVSMLTDKSYYMRLKNGLHFMQYLSK